MTTVEHRESSTVGGSVFSLLMFVGLAGTNHPLASTFPKGGGLVGSGAAEVVYDERHVDAVHVQQVQQEGAVALGIQPHGPHVIGREGGVSAPRHLREDLKDAIIQLHEEPGKNKTALKRKASVDSQINKSYKTSGSHSYKTQTLQRLNIKDSQNEKIFFV